MLQPPVPVDEAERLEELLCYAVLDTAGEPAYDDLVLIASQICDAPIALVSLVDADRQWFLAREGIDAVETPRVNAFCAHAILGSDVFVVPDAHEDERFFDNPLVTGGPKVRFYAGAPLVTPSGHALGTLCVIDHVPRTLDASQQAALQALSRQVVAQLQLRRRTAELEETESRFRVIASSLQTGIAVQGLDSRIMWTNESARRLLGLTEDQLAGRTSFDPAWRAIHADGTDFPGEEHPAVVALRTGVAQHGVMMGVYRPNSSDYVWLQVDAVPQRDREGKPFQVVVSFADISELKRAEAEAGVRASLNESILSASPMAIIVTGLDGVVTTFNVAAERLLGYRSSEVIGLHSPALWHDPNEILVRAETMSEELGEPIAAGFEVFASEAIRGLKSEREWTYIRKDGVRLEVKLRMTPVRNANGTVCGFMGLANDISLRKRAEAVLLAAKAAAETTSSAKSEFLATMSHEIRTPMNGVLGFTNLLMDTPLNDDQRLFTATIKQSGEALLAIINDILDFSKIESGKLTLESVPFDVEATIHDVTRLMTATAAERGNVLRVNYHAAAPHETIGDPTRTRQVMLNLVGNALKFTQRGTVTVGVEEVAVRGTRRLLFSVKDSGIGIHPEKHAALFQAFTQADSSTTRGYGGTGLGLAICKRLTELMDGEIGVDSTPGNGATFWFTLPLRVPARASERILMPPPVGTPAAATAPVAPLLLRVLVAEDAPVNQMLVKRLLQNVGCDADIAPDGRDAVARFEAGVYDIVLMDCHMPVMDGFEATAKIRAIEARSGGHVVRIPIIALTASAMSDDRAHCLAVGMDDFVTKPFSPQELRDALERWAVVPAAAPSCP
jgi:PAS domain S-box-containing protein